MWPLYHMSSQTGGCYFPNVHILSAYPPNFPDYHPAKYPNSGFSLNSWYKTSSHHFILNELLKPMKLLVECLAHKH
jgi:hypothetical protein